MTELLPAAPASAPTRWPVTLAPVGVVEEDASGCVDLGADWTAVRAFAGTVLALAVAALVGHRVAGPVGIVTAAGLVALVLFIAAHIRAWATSRRLTRPVPIDAYASTGARGIRSGARGPVGFFWWCGVCRVESIESATRAETLDLAAAHDRLHHRRPTAAVVASAPVASSTREA